MAEGNNQRTSTGGEEAAYDRTKFLSRSCYEKFQRDLDMSFIKERGIHMEKVDEQLPEFFQKLENNGWICFAETPEKANGTIAREFYANATRTDFSGELVTTVRGKLVRFDAAAINAVYGLENVDNALYKARASEGGMQWMVDMLQGGNHSGWSTFGHKIVSTDFTAEARIWLSIVCTRVMPSSNESDLTPEKARLVAALIDGLKVNVGEIIVREIEEVVLERTKSLFFPSLIHRLCMDAGVEIRTTDKSVGPEKPIYPLLKKGRGGVIQSKKRKVEMPSQVDVEDPAFGQFSTPDTATAPGSSYTPVPPLASGASNMRYISSQISSVDAQIRQLVAGLPSGPHGEGSSSRPLSTPSLEAVAAEQERIKIRLDKMERKQKNFGKRTSNFLNKMMSKLNSLCRASSSDEESEDELRYPNTDSEE